MNATIVPDVAPLPAGEDYVFPCSAWQTSWKGHTYLFKHDNMIDHNTLPLRVKSHLHPELF